MNGVQTAYHYDNNDRLTQTGGTTYSYDDNGNTLSETLDANTKTYVWDAKNKLTSVTQNGNNTNYTYNPDGIRTGKTENGITTHYVVDSNRDYAQVLEEVENNLTTVQYTYGHDLINQQRNHETSFYHYDGLGSTRALSNSSGTLTDAYNYEAFGEIQNQTGSTNNDYLFTGEQFDEGLNQYYLRARYYDQKIGRFTQMDSWGGNNSDPITLHKYLYANANPANYTDPSGNFSIGEFGASINIIGIQATTATSIYSTFAAKAALGALISTSGAYIASTQATKTMLKQCMEDSRAGGSKCRPNLSIFVVGDSHNEIRDHVADAQSSGSPSVVTRRAMPHPRDWLTRLKKSGVVCQGGGQCDEYPMAIHEEGGQYGMTSLRSVSASQNMSVGGMVARFHDRCEVNVGDKYKFVAVSGVAISGGICKK